MNKYFELKDKNEVLYGVIENIPSDTTIEEIKNRIESSDNEKSIKIIDMEFNQPDIVMDWLELDFENGFDEDILAISESLYESIEKGLETEVVYTALKSMKENPNLSISEAIKSGTHEWLK